MINTARGDLLDEKELVTRLKDGRIGAAGLDVYEPEPPLKDSGLWALDNVVVTPHIAAGTLEAYQEKMEFAFANIQRFLAGLTPVNLV